MSSLACPGRLEGLAGALHPALAVGGGALALAPRRGRGEHDVGELGGLGEEDVLDHQVVQALEPPGHRGGVRVGLHGVLTDDEEVGELPSSIASIISDRVMPYFGGRVTSQMRSNFARCSAFSTSWKPGRFFGIAPMSPPPWTLF